MKSFFCSLILLIILLGINIYCFEYIKTSSEKLNNYIDKTMLYAENDNKKDLQASFDTLKNEIIKSKKVWFLIINHQLIEDVEVKAEECEIYIKKEAYTELLASLNTLKYSVNNIYEREMVNIANIF